jgi:hypothetical protein
MGISVYYNEADLQELREFIIWKTNKAGATKSDSAMAFSAGRFDVDNSLRETTDLIQQARQELEMEKQRKLEQAQRGALVAQQRNSVSQLNDREAQAEIDRIREEGRIQAETYASEKNAGRGGHAYITDSQKSIRDEMKSWIQRTRLRGGLGGRKMLAKK